MKYFHTPRVQYVKESMGIWGRVRSRALPCHSSTYSTQTTPASNIWNSQYLLIVWKMFRIPLVPPWEPSQTHIFLQSLLQRLVPTRVWSSLCSCNQTIDCPWACTGYISVPAWGTPTRTHAMLNTSDLENARSHGTFFGQCGLGTNG